MFGNQPGKSRNRFAAMAHRDPGTNSVFIGLGTAVDDWRFSIGVGLTLVIAGLCMLRTHVLAWKRQQSDESLDNSDRAHLYARYRRRLQTSGLIAILGLLIPLGDSPMFWKQGPAVSTLFWGAILVITFWISLLALGDLVATRTHARIALSRIQRKQRDLEEQLAQLKKRNSNGHPPSSQ